MRYVNLTTLTRVFGMVLILGAPVYAHGGEGRHHESDVSMQHETGMNMGAMSKEGGVMGNSGDAFLVKRHIDDYDVSFHVMPAGPGMMHGGSHNFMIKIEKDGKVVNDVKLNTKVIFPDGNAQTRAAMRMGDWMMAGYDLQDSGRHQMMILFKTADGKKHRGGVYYPGN